MKLKLEKERRGGRNIETIRGRSNIERKIQENQEKNQKVKERKLKILNIREKIKSKKTHAEM